MSGNHRIGRCSRRVIRSIRQMRRIARAPSASFYCLYHESATSREESRTSGTKLTFGATVILIWLPRWEVLWKGDEVDVEELDELLVHQPHFAPRKLPARNPGIYRIVGSPPQWQVSWQRNPSKRRSFSPLPHRPEYRHERLVIICTTNRQLLDTAIISGSKLTCVAIRLADQAEKPERRTHLPKARKGAVLKPWVSYKSGGVKYS